MKKKLIPKYQEGSSTDNLYFTYDELKNKYKNRNDFLYWDAGYDLQPYIDDSESYFEGIENIPGGKDWFVKNVNNHLNDGSYIINGGLLNDVVVIPSYEDKQALKAAKQMFPYKYLRDSFAEYSNKTSSDISLNDLIRMLYNIYREAKFPKVNKPNKFTSKITFPNINIPRAFYITPNNSMYNIRNFSDYVAELSHAFLQNADKRHNLNTFSIFDGDSEIFGRAGYQRPGHYEYNAHSIIEPSITKTIKTGRNIHDNINEYLKYHSDHSDAIKRFLLRTRRQNSNNYLKNIYNSILLDAKDRSLKVDINGNAIFKHTFSLGGKLNKNKI